MPLIRQMEQVSNRGRQVRIEFAHRKACERLHPDTPISPKLPSQCIPIKRRFGSIGSSPPSTTNKTRRASPLRERQPRVPSRCQQGVHGIRRLRHALKPARAVELMVKGPWESVSQPGALVRALGRASGTKDDKLKRPALPAEHPCTNDRDAQGQCAPSKMFRISLYPRILPQ